MLRRLACAMVLGGFASAHPSAGSPPARYAVTDLGVSRSCTDINARGEVAGYVYEAAGGFLSFIGPAFVYHRGRTDSLGGGTGAAYGINDRGDLVGDFTNRRLSYVGDDSPDGWVESSGVRHGLPFTPGGIANTGQIAGTLTTEKGRSHACRYVDGTLTDLGTLGGKESYGETLNDSGQIVGYADNRQQNFHAFLYAGAAMTDLGTLGGERSYASAINNSGQIVGSAEFRKSGKFKDSTHAFLYEKGRMRDLNDLAPVGASPELYAANDIDSRGRIVGNSTSGPFLFADARLTVLQQRIPASAHWILDSADGINDAGVIIGSGRVGDPPPPYTGPAADAVSTISTFTVIDYSTYHALLLTPIPVLVLPGAKNVTTHRSRLLIRGRSGSATRFVSYRAGSRGKFIRASGTVRWHFIVALHPGENVITIHAAGYNGTFANARLTVTRE